MNVRALSIFGGSKVRSDPPPFRAAMGPAERQAVLDVLDYYDSSKADPPYEGVFQKKFENEFANLMGGGSARAVSSGSVACFIAIRALRLPLGSEIIVPGVTDSGSPAMCTAKTAEVFDVIAGSISSQFVL